MRSILLFAVILSGSLIVFAYHPNLLSGPETVGFSIDTSTALLPHLITTTSVIGAIVVFVVYWIKFNQWTGPTEAPAGFSPHPTSHSTTWSRYVLWASIYAGFMVGIYAFIILFPQVLVNLEPAMKAFGIDAGPVNALKDAIGDPGSGPDKIVPYALIMTLLVWGELIKRPELEFRHRMQLLALIPEEGNSLVRRMGSDKPPFLPDDDIVKRILENDDRSLFSQDDFLAKNSSVFAMFARCIYLNSQVLKVHNDDAKKVASRHKKERGQIATLITKLTKEFEKFRQDEIDFLKKLVNEKPDTPKNKELRAKLSELLNKPLTLSVVDDYVKAYNESEIYALRYFSNFRQQLRSEVSSLMTRLNQVAVCTLLAVAHTPGARRKLFRKLGFENDDPFAFRLHRETIARAGFVLLGAIGATTLIYFFIFGPGISESGLSEKINKFMPESYGQVWLWILYGCVMHLLGVFGGYLMEKARQVSEFAGSEDTSVQVRLADLLESFAMAVALNIFFFAILALPQENWTYAVQSSWIWVLAPGVTGAFTSYYMQRVRRSRGVSGKLAILQGVVTALITVLSLLAVHDSLRQVQDYGSLDAFQNFAIYALLSALILGTAMGLFLQDWVTREAISGALENRASSRRPSNAEGAWISGDSSCKIRLQDISDSGVKLRTEINGGSLYQRCYDICYRLFRIKTSLPAEIGTAGVLTLDGGKNANARVVRHVEDAFTCLAVDFDDAAAKRV